MPDPTSCPLMRRRDYSDSTVTRPHRSPPVGISHCTPVHHIPSLPRMTPNTQILSGEPQHRPSGRPTRPDLPGVAGRYWPSGLSGTARLTALLVGAALAARALVAQVDSTDLPKR